MNVVPQRESMPKTYNAKGQRIIKKKDRRGSFVTDVFRCPIVLFVAEAKYVFMFTCFRKEKQPGMLLPTMRGCPVCDFSYTCKL